MAGTALLMWRLLGLPVALDTLLAAGLINAGVAAVIWAASRAAARARIAAVVFISTFPLVRLGRPTNLMRLREGYEILTAHCEPRPEPCTPVRVTGDPREKEAWGFRARPAADSLWKEPEVFYAVADRARCDQVRAALGTPSEACWGPVYFRRQ